jgi:hypothetical protein
LHPAGASDARRSAGTYQITIDDEITATAPRMTSRDIKRHKAPATSQPVIGRHNYEYELCDFCLCGARGCLTIRH